MRHPAHDRDHAARGALAPGVPATHDRHAGHSVAMFRTRFWVALVLTIPTVVWGHMLASATGWHAPELPGSGWIGPVFGTAVFAYGGEPFLRGAVRELRDRLPGMMTLIALAITVAFAFSFAVTVGYPGMPLWEELSTLVTVMLLGHWIEMRSISQAQGALHELAKLLPSTAVRLEDGREEEVPLAALRDGDVVLVRPGARIPADGVVRSGASAVDESTITGESRPVEKRPAEGVIAGTVNGAGSLRVEVTGTGEKTALAGIMRLVERAEALRVAAAVERDSEHPVAQAVVRTARERGVSIPRAEGFEALPGHGVRARVDGRERQVGGPNLLRRVGARVGPEVEALARDAAERGQSAVFLVEDGEVVAAFAVADAVRPESAEAVRRLHGMGMEVAMLTGDSRAVAEAVARELGIDTVHAEVLPDRKAEVVEALRREGRRVAMVGDGVNDAPALVTADVGIAVGAGTDVAVEAGDVVLVRSDPRDVPRAIALSRATWRKMVQNLWWAAGYNVAAIPLAAGLLAPWGVVLAPAAGAVLMSVSTVIVAVNAQLLRRAEL
jgi:cation transport ATPase